MALDPSIILANADPSRQYDPVASMMKAQSLKSAMQQGQIQQQQLQDAQDFRSKHGISPDMAQAQQKVQLGNLEKTKAEREAAKAHIESVAALNDQQAQEYEAALKALDKSPDKAPDIHAAVLQRTGQNAKTAFPNLDTSKSDDPRSFAGPAAFTATQAPFAPGPDAPQKWDVGAQREWLLSQLDKTGQSKKALEAAKLKIEQDREERLGNAPKGEIANFAASLGKTVDDPVVKQLWKEYHPNATTNVNLGGDAWSPSKHDFGKPLPNAQTEGMAYDFADGKPQPNITSRTPQHVVDAINRGREIYKDANNGDGQGYGTNAGVLGQARKAWAPGGPQLAVANAVDVTVGHLAARDQYIDALKNHDAAALNAAANYFKTKFNLSTAPNDLRTINTLVAPEIAKVVKGSTQTNESEIQDIKRQLGDDLASEIQKSGGQVFRGAMGTRLEVMENNYKAAYPGKSLSRVLLPTTVKTFSHVFGGEPGAAGGLSPAQLPKLSLEEAAKLKPGERFLDMNGKERVKN